MYHLKVSEEFNSIHSQDLWVYNKLQLSRILGYTCGPAGMEVPKSGFYIVRPSVNFMGMGRLSRIEWLEYDTEHLHPAEFWCEIFEGEHLSVDFYKKESKLVVKGTKSPKNPLYKWEKWEKIDKKVDFPPILNNLVGNYDYINCEFIKNNLIEVHFRQNSDFRYGNTVAIPVWDENSQKNYDHHTFVVDEDYKRKGFWIK
jgi:hypothetical protein